MAPRRGEEGEEDYIPGPIREFGESLSEIVKGPFVAFQQLGDNVKEFAKPFKALSKGIRDFTGDREEDEGSPLGLLYVASKGLGKILKGIGAFLMTSLLLPMLALAKPLAIIVGFFITLNTVAKLLIGGFTKLYNFFAEFIPGMDPIGTKDEKTTKRMRDRGATEHTMKTDEELGAEHRIAQRNADAGGPLKGMKVDMFGNNLQDKADELKQQIDMRDRYKENFGSQGLMNIINNQTNSSTSVETKITPQASNRNTIAVT